MAPSPRRRSTLEAAAEGSWFRSWLDSITFVSLRETSKHLRDVTLAFGFYGIGEQARPEMQRLLGLLVGTRSIGGEITLDRRCRARSISELTLAMCPPQSVNRTGRI